jgi:hypothetical protein
MAICSACAPLCDTIPFSHHDVVIFEMDRVIRMNREPMLFFESPLPMNPSNTTLGFRTRIQMRHVRDLDGLPERSQR